MSDDEPKVIIMRGLPGSGKTRFLSQHCPEAEILSTDARRMVDGKYVYKKEDDERLHAENLKEFLFELANGIGVYTLAVDNTNLRVWEIAPYYQAAKAYGCDVLIVQMVVHPDICAVRNTHGVPPERIRQMAATMEPLPPWWNVQYV